ncbi:outer membrane protein [Roseovarius autotrophicus]|uniref:outer membrane protein n=1 Tax=Roseovarius autotrophicus TaxID=2824121 RepID=UPI0019F4FFDC|nr:outer membrane beta-barrel protein [Roseovarius autotrophicus]MBE0453545.1 porin family protein [Roseovarius sp.]
MRLLLPALAASLALASPALAQNASDTARAPAFPQATGYPVSTDLSFDGQSEVSRSTNSVFSTRGRAIGGDVNWTGFYVGGQLGVAFGDADFESSDESVIGGVTLGYDHDFGQWVLGGALDYDFTDIDIAPNASLEEIFRVKLRAGPKIGRGLLYGTGGYAYADSDNMGSENGWFIGGGYEYMVNDRFSVGGELLYHEFDGFDGTGNDVDVTTVQVRATFRF